MQIHLIDGTYELFRAFYGAPSAQGPDGREVGGTRGLLRSLLAMLQAPEVTHVGIAFDHVIESFRNDLFDGYKTGEGIDPDLWNQFPLAEELSYALGIAVWPMVEFEADDAIASAAAKWRDNEKVERVLLCSPDKDFAQCVRGTDVVLFDRMREKLIDEKGVWEKWGIKPASMPDYLALVGDTADGIPGIPRWGAKSTSTVLAEYEHLENIPDDEAEWSVKVRGAKSLAANLREQRKDAELYKLLATLRTDAPIPESLVQMRWRGADRPRLEKLCEEIGDTRAISRVPAWRD
jgi:5'-3' exonuclease